jgi:hypothetical protein
MGDTLVTPAGGASVVDVIVIGSLLARAPAGIVSVEPSRLTVPPVAPVGVVTDLPSPIGWLELGPLGLLEHQTSERDSSGSKRRSVRLWFFMQIVER